jgi:hypothetical protein
LSNVIIYVLVVVVAEVDVEAKKRLIAEYKSSIYVN